MKKHRIHTSVSYEIARKLADHFGQGMNTRPNGRRAIPVISTKGTYIRNFLLEYIPVESRKFHTAVAQAAEALNSMYTLRTPTYKNSIRRDGIDPVRIEVGHFLEEEYEKINRFIDAVSFSLMGLDSAKWGAIAKNGTLCRAFVCEWAAESAMKKYPKVDPNVTAEPESVTMPIDYPDAPTPDDDASRAELLDAAYGDLGECPIMAADDEIRAQVAALAARVTKLEAERYRDKSDFPKYL